MLLARMGTGSQGGPVAQAVDFDGANDYLSRASDLTGNADGKTFTFSAWFENRLVSPGATQVLYASGTGGSDGFKVIVGQDAAGSYYFQVLAYDTSNTNILAANAHTTQFLPLGRFVHLLISVDLANTTNRHFYINDAQFEGMWATYTNGTINFTNTSHYAGGNSSSKLTGRLAHVYFDKTYRDLSNSANRRLFITADRKLVSKASLAALNPILYLPMDDPATAHKNSGTGGDFVLNGTIARSGRGPNQFNAAYSDLDGSADFLTRTSLSGVADGNQLTLHFVLNSDDVSTTRRIIGFASGTSARFYAYFQSGGQIRIEGLSSAGSALLDMWISGFAVSRNYVVTVSIDLSSTTKRHAYVNGVAASATWSTYTNGTINFAISSSPTYRVGANHAGGDLLNARLGELFFHTSYIDLSIAANREKFVNGTGIDAKPADLGANGEKPLGTSPLIYLPMVGNNAGKNYGTGGDFTVNSGPFTGARGPNEFWGNWTSNTANSTGVYLYNNALNVPSTKTFSLSFALRIATTTGGHRVFWTMTSGLSDRIAFTINSSNNLTVDIRDAGSTQIAVCNNLIGTMSLNTTYFVQLCMDLSDQTKTKVYVNGALYSPTWNVHANAFIGDTSRFELSGNNPSLQGGLAEVFFTTEYIDFSQEANRLKFRDAFGNPVDIPAQITAKTLNRPLVYMRFDPSNQGANAGSGGNFTKNGTINDGGQL